MQGIAGRLRTGPEATTHSIDPRELLRQLKDYRDEEGLEVAGRPEELQHGDLLLLGHPDALIFHLLDLLDHILGAPQPLEDWGKEAKGMKTLCVSPPAPATKLFPASQQAPRAPIFACLPASFSGSDSDVSVKTRSEE